MKRKTIKTEDNQHVISMVKDVKLKKLIEIKKKFNRFDMHNLNVVERDF